jgi:hypothetical protein
MAPAALSLILGCTTTEKAIAPLGFGPLAQAEEVAQQRNASEQQAVDKNKTNSHQAPPGLPFVSSGESRIAIDTTAKVTSETSPATAASIGKPEAPIAPKTLADWLGLWHGKDTTHYQIPSFPSEPMDDPKARIRVESSSSQQVAFILIDSSNEKDICALSAHLEATQAKIDPGQPCFGGDDDSNNLSIRVKSGVGTLRDAALVVELLLDAEVQSEQFQANGTVEYHFEGKR